MMYTHRKLDLFTILAMGIGLAAALASSGCSFSGSAKTGATVSSKTVSAQKPCRIKGSVFQVIVFSGDHHWKATTWKVASGLFITNAHVCSDLTANFVIVSGRNFIQASVLKRFDKHDLCALKTAATNLADAPVLLVASTSPMVGTALVSYGFPAGRGTWTSGSYLGQKLNFMPADFGFSPFDSVVPVLTSSLKGAPGASRSPIVDVRACRVVGVANMIDASNSLYGVPLESLLNFLDEIGE